MNSIINSHTSLTLLWNAREKKGTSALIITDEDLDDQHHAETTRHRVVDHHADGISDVEERAGSSTCVARSSSGAGKQRHERYEHRPPHVPAAAGRRHGQQELQRARREGTKCALGCTNGHAHLRRPRRGQDPASSLTFFSGGILRADTITTAQRTARGGTDKKIRTPASADDVEHEEAARRAARLHLARHVVDD